MIFLLKALLATVINGREELPGVQQDVHGRPCRHSIDRGNLLLVPDLLAYSNTATCNCGRQL